MKRIYLIAVALLFLLPVAPIPALAVGEFTVHELYDPHGLITKGPYYNASKDSIQVDIRGTDAVRGNYAAYPDSSFSSPNHDKFYDASQYGWSYFTGLGFNCNTHYAGTLFDAQGNILIRVKLTITGLVAPVCNSESGGEDMGGGGECDNCAIFDCPGWSEYMGMLEQIRAAIPPPPNWYEVADIFRDSIAPRIKQDMADLIGSAPEPVMPTLPSTPIEPTVPQALDPMDDHGFSAPTGEEAPGLGDAGFTSSKIKDEAPEIEFREDPTGGFSITDPVGSLPSQEEFRKNAPKEGEVPLPGDPEELENIAPTPEDTTDAPPKPGDIDGSAPVPGDIPDTPPIPENLGDKVPIPEDTHEKAPIPGGSNP